MMYQEYKDISDLYVLHRYSIGTSQGDESFLEEVMATGNDKKQLEDIGESKWPKGSGSGWRYDSYQIVVNTATEEGKRLHEEYKADNRQAWKDIDEHLENYTGAPIVGNRSDEDSSPIALWIQPNPLLDNTEDKQREYKLESYQYIVFDISEPDNKEL